MTALVIVLAVALAVTLCIIFWSRRPEVAGNPDYNIRSVADFNATLHGFLDVAGETLWSNSGGQRHLESESEKYRCLHFTFGAIKKLAEGVPNHKLGNDCAGMASFQEATYWFGSDAAMDVIRDYGRRVNYPDPEVQVPAQAGYSLMQRFLAGSASDTFDGYTSLKDELRQVIRGYSTVQPELNKPLAIQGSQVGNLHQSLESFLALLEVSQPRGPGQPAFKTDHQRRRCLYFIWGAGHRLAQAAPSDQEAGEFYLSMASEQARRLFGESQGHREVALHLEYVGDPSQAPAILIEMLEDGQSAMNQYLNGIEGFSPETVAGVIRTNFMDAVLGDDTSSAK